MQRKFAGFEIKYTRLAKINPKWPLCDSVFNDKSWLFSKESTGSLCGEMCQNVSKMAFYVT